MAKSGGLYETFSADVGFVGSVGGGVVIDRGFPGQPSNPVGFNHAPGWPGAFQNGSATFMGGIYAGLTNPVAIGDGTGGTLLLQSNTTYYYLDITPRIADFENILTQTGGVGGAAVANVKFLGCRFTAATQNHISNVNQYQTGSSGLIFSYCTMAPLVALAPHPTPVTAWPSSGVGLDPGIIFNNPTYQVPWLSSARDSITVNVAPGDTLIIDHCDMWGTAEIIGLSGNVWTGANNPISGVNGQLLVTDCWMHDNRIPTATPWSASTNYNIGDYASSTIDFNNYIAIAASGPGHGGPVDPTGGNASWSFFATFDHGNGIIATNAAGSSNVTVRHCTISGLGNTDNITFSHLQTVGTFWSASLNYSIGNQVGAADGFYYSAVVASGPGNGGAVNPTGNLHTGTWTQFGFNGYQNMVVRSCWISGYNDGVDLGIGNSGQTGMTFEDNIISNDVRWFTRICAVTGLSNAGPYSPFLDAPGQNGMFTAQPTNSWRRNTYNVYPGSASYDAANQAKNGFFVWPDGTLNATDWPN